MLRKHRITRGAMVVLCLVTIAASVAEVFFRDITLGYATLPIRMLVLVGLVVAMYVVDLHPVVVGRVYLVQGLATMVFWSFVVGDGADGMEVLVEAVSYGTILSVFSVMVAPVRHRRWWSFGVVACVLVATGVRILPGDAEIFFQAVSVLSIHAVALTRLDSHASQAERVGVLGSTDELTGLRNRRPMLLRLEEGVERRREERTTSSLVILDLDEFKRVNDEHGHGAGDLVLQRVARVLSENVRPIDVVSRWGGEEFLILLPEIDRAGAIEVAERLRVSVADTGVTASFGVEEIDPEESVESWIARADRSMYISKREGRNRVSSLGLPGTSRRIAS